MKVFANIVKLLTALAAVAGAVYVIATYGEQIVAWAKKILASLPCPNCEEAEPVAEEAPVEEAAVEETVAEEAPVEEVPAEEVAEVVVEETEPVAEEADFAE
ncbi:MAG: hypothetical protein IJ001_03370 [Oscillospiraceae bacterium]|nr:hypothetical protein [Oscillospiraceae bacterium]